LEGKFKLSQKNSLADREGAIEGLRAIGDPESLEVARLMGEILPRPK
ncbi:MAG: FMN-binding negative transcriptional regulator, partial [Proteobacteria bacterium]|nr:FMN-binding negative transcriptional regulator [Pseudomonadota bacterium]